MENLICEGIDLILCTVIWAGLSGFLWGGGKGKDKSFFIYAILSVFTAPLVVLLVGSFKMSLGWGIANLIVGLLAFLLGQLHRSECGRMQE